MTNVAEGAAREAPSTWGQRLRLVGPGIVIAVTGVGAGDMISSLVAGTNFGTVLIWAIIIGALFLPFLAITLMLLLNSRRVAPEYRNRLITNILLAVSVIPFIVVGVQEVLGAL